MIIETITYENTAGLLGVFERTYDILGRVTTDVTPNGTRSYVYDGIGRLVEVEDRELSDVVVETREYTFDADTNRTALTTTPAVGAPTSVTYMYDTADRLTTVTGGSNPGSYTYDTNGNTLTTPDLTLTWTGDNRLATTSDGTTTVTWGLDAHGRTLSRSDGTVTSAYRYSSDGDTPSWTIDGTATSRYVPGPAGLSAVDVAGGDVTWLLPAPHGDVWAHTDDTGAITATFAYDEYGVAQAAPTGDLELDRYGWLGQQQRETDPATGLILMGVRAYDPNLGRFLSVDSVHGGSANHYDYCYSEPINCFDLDGKSALKKGGRSLINIGTGVLAAAGAALCVASVVCAVGVVVGAAVVGVAAHRVYGAVTKSQRSWTRDIGDSVSSAAYGVVCRVSLGAGCGKAVLGKQAAKHVASAAQRRLVTAAVAGTMWGGTKGAWTAGYAAGSRLRRR